MESLNPREFCLQITHEDALITNADTLELLGLQLANVAAGSETSDGAYVYSLL